VKDGRTQLFREFARCVSAVQPIFFVAENVSGLQKLRDGVFLSEQVRVFQGLGDHGYELSYSVLDAKDYGVPQSRKRLFIVGVRKDLGRIFRFPSPTHGRSDKRESKGLLPFASHGEAIRDLPLWPSGEFYERPHDPEGHFSWYYMSRNRKAPWDGPSFTIVANWRHITLHPASPVMTLTWSNLADGWKQRWDFSKEYEHTKVDASRQTLEIPRRLSWRECAAIQTFPQGYEPIGDVESKFNQIGNAVPPRLASVMLSYLLSEKGLIRLSENSTRTGEQRAFALG
jgi:DNA (cytosine-5)-methyltransferase 1